MIQHDSPSVTFRAKKWFPSLGIKGGSSSAGQTGKPLWPSPILARSVQQFHLILKVNPKADEMFSSSSWYVTHSNMLRPHTAVLKWQWPHLSHGYYQHIVIGKIGYLQVGWVTVKKNGRFTPRLVPQPVIFLLNKASVVQHPPEQKSNQAVLLKAAACRTCAGP